MMRRWVRIGLFAVAALLSSLAFADGVDRVIAVELTGFEHDGGKALIALYAGEEGFPTDSARALRRVAVSIVGKKAKTELGALRAGDYALSVIHDENNNGKLDSNFIGIPKEPVGASNNAKGRMGPPQWKDAKFRLDQGRVVQRIVVRRL